jgi:hypothetical protein
LQEANHTVFSAARVTIMAWCTGTFQAFGRVVGTGCAGSPAPEPGPTPAEGVTL